MDLTVLATTLIDFERACRLAAGLEGKEEAVAADLRPVCLRLSRRLSAALDDLGCFMRPDGWIWPPNTPLCEVVVMEFDQHEIALIMDILEAVGSLNLGAFHMHVALIVAMQDAELRHR
jgi:hypothetical protein